MSNARNRATRVERIASATKSKSHRPRGITTREDPQSNGAALLTEASPQTPALKTKKKTAPDTLTPPPVQSRSNRSSLALLAFFGALAV